MRPTNFDVHELIQSLQGTCTTTDEHLPDGMSWDDLTKEDHKTIDNEIFLCEECGWWCENDEYHEGELCNDCYSGNDEDDDD